jgi:hypothetical protein
MRLFQRAAKVVEASIIELLGKDTLTNKVSGDLRGARGLMSVREVISHYTPDEADISHRVVIIRPRRQFRYDMTPVELYEITRGVWQLRTCPLAEKASVALCVHDGVVQEVYLIAGWHKGGSTVYWTRSPDDVLAPDRREFVGQVADDAIRSHYILKSVKKHIAHQCPVYCPPWKSHYV